MIGMNAADCRNWSVSIFREFDISHMTLFDTFSNPDQLWRTPVRDGVVKRSASDAISVLLHYGLTITVLKVSEIFACEESVSEVFRRNEIYCARSALCDNAVTPAIHFYVLGGHWNCSRTFRASSSKYIDSGINARSSPGMCKFCNSYIYYSAFHFGFNKYFGRKLI